MNTPSPEIITHCKHTNCQCCRKATLAKEQTNEYYWIYICEYSRVENIGGRTRVHKHRIKIPKEETKKIEQFQDDAKKTLVVTGVGSIYYGGKYIYQHGVSNKPKHIYKALKQHGVPDTEAYNLAYKVDVNGFVNNSSNALNSIPAGQEATLGFQPLGNADTANVELDVDGVGGGIIKDSATEAFGDNIANSATETGVQLGSEVVGESVIQNMFTELAKGFFEGLKESFIINPFDKDQFS